MAKQNCWDFKKCGREQDGAKMSELGICAVAAATYLNGLHGGRNGGRACWMLSSGQDGRQVKGTVSAILGNGMKCEFFQIVKAEEGINLESTERFRQNNLAYSIVNSSGENRHCASCG